MKEDKVFRVNKEIPILNSKPIAVGTEIRRTHGVYYMEGYMFPKDYQQDFDALAEKESREGWKYLVPISDKIAFRNSKEKF